MTRENYKLGQLKGPEIQIYTGISQTLSDQARRSSLSLGAQSSPIEAGILEDVVLKQLLHLVPSHHCPGQLTRAGVLLTTAL